LVEIEGDMKNYFKYELTSLFENGIRRKRNKSNLAKAIKQGVSKNRPTPSKIYYVLDGGSLLHEVKLIPNITYKSILNQYSNYVKNKYGKGCIVFDGYENGPYVKDHDHKRTTGKFSPLVNLSNLETLQDVQLVPCNWGWLLLNGCYESIMADMNPEPDNILHVIRCNCNTSKKRPCSTNICSCRKHGLVCVSACGDCHGVNWDNCEKEIDIETNDGDGNIFDIFEFV